MPDALARGTGVAMLKARRDFLALRNVRKVATPGFVLQARERPRDDGPARIGFTCSKKVGNAVARNRAKRRLRAVARDVLPGLARPGWDYALIGRAGETAVRPMERLACELRQALDRVHATPKTRGAGRPAAA